MVDPVEIMNRFTTFNPSKGETPLPLPIPGHWFRKICALADRIATSENERDALLLRLKREKNRSTKLRKRLSEEKRLHEIAKARLKIMDSENIDDYFTLEKIEEIREKLKDKVHFSEVSQVDYLRALNAIEQLFFREKRIKDDNDRLANEARSHKLGREHTWYWLKSHYGKLEEWARQNLPDDLKNEFFNSLANGLPNLSKSSYIRYDTAQEQIINDQIARAENAEIRNAQLMKKIQASKEIVNHITTNGRRCEFLSGVEDIVPDVLIDAWLSIEE